MHIVPAPAESLMKSRVLSIPGLQGVMDGLGMDTGFSDFRQGWVGRALTPHPHVVPPQPLDDMRWLRGDMRVRRGRNARASTLVFPLFGLGALSTGGSCRQPNQTVKGKTKMRCSGARPLRSRSSFLLNPE